MKELFTSDSVRLHVLRSEGSDSPETPVLFLPEYLGTADEFKDEIEFIQPRKSATFSYRGRGQSEILPSGKYSFQHHLEDISVVLQNLGWNQAILVAHSVSVAFAIGYALKFPDQVKALLIMDYPASYRKPSPLWLETILKARPGQTKPEVIQAIFDESRDLPLWEKLPEIKCPVQLVRGGTQGSLLSDPEGQTYLQSLKFGNEIVFRGSGHKLKEPDRDRYMQMIRNFVKQHP